METVNINLDCAETSLTCMKVILCQVQLQPRFRKAKRNVLVLHYALEEEFIASQLFLSSPFLKTLFKVNFKIVLQVL